VNTVLTLPLPLRLTVLFVVGLFFAGGINLAIYQLAWNRRSISPWSRGPEGTRRSWPDRLPLLGWLRLRRESHLHGRVFWLRPLLLEIATGGLFAGLYYWEVVVPHDRLLLPNMLPPRLDLLSADATGVLHLRFLSHLLLALLMLVATFIDVDEKTIPDSITIPGTVLGLLLAAMVPWSLPAAGKWLIDGTAHFEFLTLASPDVWPDWLSNPPRHAALGIALGCWTLWCVALLPRRWNMRRGLRTAWNLFWQRIYRERFSYWIGGLWLLGLALISGGAIGASDAAWAGLLSSLVGMAAGGATIWTVRIIGTAVLQREAMGFGDVTLMAMIGTFTGWQPILAIFFIAPFLGLLIAVMNAAFHGEHEIPYGPFLCLAAMTVIVQWNALWERTADIFALGWILPAVFACCLALMGILLWIYRVLRDTWTGESP